MLNDSNYLVLMHLRAFDMAFSRLVWRTNACIRFTMALVYRPIVNAEEYTPVLLKTGVNVSIVSSTSLLSSRSVERQDRQLSILLHRLRF